MHTFWKKKRKKRTRSAASLPPYKTNSWKEKKKKNQPIFFLHEKSDKANSVKKEKKAWQLPFVEDQSHLTLGKKRMSPPLYGVKRRRKN